VRRPVGRAGRRRVLAGYRNVLWGDDYPHLEGTYGHTQETLRGLFAGAEDEVRERITSGTFNELFSVPEQTAQEAAR
jgi:hypothetical protein